MVRLEIPIYRWEGQIACTSNSDLIAVLDHLGQRIKSVFVIAFGNLYFPPFFFMSLLLLYMVFLLVFLSFQLKSWTSKDAKNHNLKTFVNIEPPSTMLHWLAAVYSEDSFEEVEAPFSPFGPTLWLLFSYWRIYSKAPGNGLKDPLQRVFPNKSVHDGLSSVSN